MTPTSPIHPYIGPGIEGVISAQELQEQCEAGYEIGFNFDKETEEWSQSSSVRGAVAGTIADCDYWFDASHDFDLDDQGQWGIDYTVTDAITDGMYDKETEFV